MSAAWVPGEVPPADETTAGWWEATTRHRWVLQECGSCGHLQHPPRAVCTGCSRMESLGWREVSGEGTVDSFTTVHRAPRPGVEVPYTVARVRLGEGPLVLSRLEPAHGWAIGDPVAPDWVDLPDGRALPIFRRPHPKEL